MLLPLPDMTLETAQTDILPSHYVPAHSFVDDCVTCCILLLLLYFRLPPNKETYLRLPLLSFVAEPFDDILLVHTTYRDVRCSVRCRARPSTSPAWWWGSIVLSYDDIIGRLIDVCQSFAEITSSTLKNICIMPYGGYDLKKTTMTMLCYRWHRNSMHWRVLWLDWKVVECLFATEEFGWTNLAS